MLTKIYRDLLRQARRAGEAEDLLQSALLAAVEAGRDDLSRPENRRWLGGVLTRQAAFEARTTARRRRRESLWQAAPKMQAAAEPVPRALVEALPRALRTTALLVLTGHSRTEIAWLQNLSDAALRQRIADIRRRWRGQGDGYYETNGLAGGLQFGRIRRALPPLARRRRAALASHDPDGHLFIIASPHESCRGGNNST